MKNSTKAFKALKEIIRKPYLLNKVIDSDKVWKKYMEKKYAFPGFPLVKLEDLFKNTAKTVYPFTFTDGGSLITDLILLKSAAMSFPNCLYFEIGTWRGESVANVAPFSSECFTLNLSESELIKLNLSMDYIRQIGLFSKGIKNITQLYGNSLSYDYRALNKKFDVIFIDGNHHYDYVLSDTKNVFNSLVHENSIVIWHDYAFNPQKIRPEVASAILDGTPKDFHPFIYHPEGTISAVCIRKKLSGNPIEPFTVPNCVYHIDVQKTDTENYFDKVF